MEECYVSIMEYVYEKTSMIIKNYFKINDDNLINFKFKNFDNIYISDFEKFIYEED